MLCHVVLWPDKLGASLVATLGCMTSLSLPPSLCTKFSNHKPVSVRIRSRRENFAAMRMKPSRDARVVHAGPFIDMVSG